MGKIDGINEGVASDKNMGVYAERLTIPEDKSAKYWIGFGAGYEKGQKIRKILAEDKNSLLSLDEKVSYYLILRKYEHRCKTNLSDSFLEKTGNRDITTLPAIGCINSMSWLQKKRLQRAVDEVLHFYKDNFHIKGYLAVEVFADMLRKLREAKRKDAPPSAKAVFSAEEIETRFREWLNEHGLQL
ncbi:hypothetical protein ACTHGU_05410 [Chitinophagaceae bacterium MMS25-I14]